MFKINKELLNKSVDDLMDSRIKIFPCHANRASELGHPCLKYLVLNRTRWKDKLRHDIGLEYIFNMGRWVEKIVRDILMDAGFEVSQSQRGLYEKAQNISGHIDLFLTHPKLLPIPILSEIKGLSQLNMAGITDYESMLHHKQYYVKKYTAQIQIYMYQCEVENSLFILYNKQSGRLKFIPVEFDYEYMESILKKAELINKHVANGTVPEKSADVDISVCESCPFRHICFEDKNWGSGMSLLEEPEVEQLIISTQSLKPQKAQYEKEYKEIKKYFNDRANESGEKKNQFMIGDYVIQVNMNSKGSWLIKIALIKKGL